jgi:hypothetical protein
MPLRAINVVASVRTTPPSMRGSRRFAKVTFGGSGTSDKKTAIPATDKAPSAATNPMVQRQSPSPPMTAPIGVPNAVETVRPATTTESA